MSIELDMLFFKRISARQIKRLRYKAKIYLVLRSNGEPGFPEYSADYLAHLDLHKYEEVLAREPMEAAYRFMKRKKALLELVRYDFTPDQTDKSYAKLRVIPKDNPYEKFVTYWR